MSEIIWQFASFYVVTTFWAHEVGLFLVFFCSLSMEVLAELRRPEGPPSGAPYSFKKEKKTHELIFSWLSWLTVLLVDACARRRRRQRRRRSRAIWWPYPNNRLTETCSLGLPCTSAILDIHVMINWHLSNQGIRWPVSRDHIAGSSLQLMEVTCFLKLTADQVLVFDWIAGACQVNLSKTGQNCSEAGLTQD